MMRTAVVGLLCLLALVPTALFADSVDSITPASFFQYDIEQFATLSGVNLIGNVSTQVVFSGPAGDFTINGSPADSNTLFTEIPDPVLGVTGTYSVTVLANDDTGTRTLGPVFITVIARAVGPQPPLLFVPEAVVAEAAGPSGANVTFDVSGISFVDPVPIIVCTPASGSLFSVGVTTVSCTATDSSNLSTTATFAVNVTDTVAPVVNVPANIVSGSPTVSFTVTATDAIDGDIPSNQISCTPSSGSQFPAGTSNVVCRATDSHDNIGTASFHVTVIGGANAPVLTLPGDILAEATSGDGATVPFVVTATESATIVCTPASGTTFALGLTNVSCSATSTGGTSTDNFNVTVVDTMPPVLTLPDPITASAPSPDGATVTYTTSAIDLVDGTLPVICDHDSGSTFPIGTTTVVCVSTDQHLNTGVGSFTVLVQAGDTTPPVLTLPGNITTEATSSFGAVVTFTATANDDVVGPVPVSCDHASGATFPIGSTTVQCSATDAHNNTSSGSFLITVRDTTPPTLSLPANITAEATSASGAAVTYVASASDIVDGSVPVSCDHASGSTFALGATTTVQCTATDAHHNTSTGSFTVTVRDTTPPTLSLPANITAEATSTSGAVVTYTASASDIVDGSVPVSCDHASGSTFAFGSTTVQCTATDAHHNAASGSFTVTVRDTTPPTLVLPANITKEATGASGATATYVVSASDTVDGSVPATCDHASGSTFAIGTTTVQCTATDAHHNTGTGSFLVTVRDTTPPVLSLPANITKEATSHSGATVSYTATSTDIVDGTDPVHCDHASGSTFPLGTTVVQCTATDAHNNTAHGSFSVLVHDTTAPQIVRIDATPDILWPPDHRMVNVSLSVIATDAVDPAPMSHIVSVSSSQPVTGFGDGDTSPDWVITGPLTLQLRAERLEPIACLIAIILPGVQCDRIYTITVATTDASGNTSQGAVTVDVANPRGRAVH